MKQDISVASHTRDPLSLPPSAFYFQLALWIAVTVDFTLRYWLRWKARSYVQNGVDYELLKFSFDDVFVLLSFLPFTAYTWLLFHFVINQHSTRMFFASRIPLQYALVFTQLAQSCLYKRVQISRPRVRTHIILTSLLALLSAVLVTCSPTTEMQTYRAIIITMATVVNEIYNTAILTHCVWTTRSTLPGIGHTLAWVLRVISAIITAVVGGYYLRTFWSPWSIQVVLCQQLNLLFSMAITRGLGFWSAWKQYATVGRSPTHEQPQSTVRRSTDFPWTGSQAIELRLDPECAATNSQFGDGQSATSITTLFKSPGSTDAKQPMTDQIVHHKLEQKAADALYGTDFGSATWSQSHRDATSESNLECTADPETLLARKWSINAGSKPSVTEDDMIESLTGVRVIGVERWVDVNGVKWRYLTKPDDITCTKHLTEGIEEKYGYVRRALNLQNGYQYISFGPKWVGYQQLSQGRRRELWEMIGRIFWNHTDLAHSARWQGIDERYQNLSTGLEVHLCARRECETCSAVHG